DGAEPLGSRRTQLEMGPVTLFDIAAVAGEIPPLQGAMAVVGGVEVAEPENCLPTTVDLTASQLRETATGTSGVVLGGVSGFFGSLHIREVECEGLVAPGFAGRNSGGERGRKLVGAQQLGPDVTVLTAEGGLAQDHGMGVGTGTDHAQIFAGV